MKTLLLFIGISVFAMEYGKAQEVKQTRKEDSIIVAAYFTRLSQAKFHPDTISPIRTSSSPVPQRIILHYKISSISISIMQPYRNYNLDLGIHKSKFSEHFATMQNRFNYPNYKY